MRGFKPKRLEKVNSEVLMIASGQNVMRLLSFRSKGPRRVAPVSGSRPSRVSWCPKTSREMHMGPSGTFFNRLVHSPKFAVKDASIRRVWWHLRGSRLGLVAQR